MLIVPPGNPSVRILFSGKISYSAPASGDVLYSVGANAAVPTSGELTDCTPFSKSTSVDAIGNPLKAILGDTVTPMEIDFSGCS